MFVIQRKKFFPLPDYDLSKNKVQVTIIGRVLDMKYALKLAQMPDLSLGEIMLLDKIAEQKKLSGEEARSLKAKHLIEGRKPNYFISANVANATDEKEKYIRMRGFKDDHYKKMILDYIDQYGFASKANIDRLLLDILPAVLDDAQKQNKVRNLIYALSKKEEVIKNQGTIRYPRWVKNAKD